MQVRDNGCEAGRSSDGTFCFDVEYRIFNSVCIYIYMFSYVYIIFTCKYTLFTYRYKVYIYSIYLYDIYIQSIEILFTYVYIYDS